MKIESIESVVTRYLEVFPSEREGLGLLLRHLGSGAELSRAGNPLWHVTASAFVLSRDERTFLLISHRALGLWIPPGGHVEGDTALSECARREVEEEVALSGLALHPWHGLSGCPLDIDTHPIPENPAKAEAAHVHHDFRYVFRTTRDDAVAVAEQEIGAFRWHPIGVDIEDASGRRALRKLRRLPAMA